MAKLTLDTIAKYDEISKINNNFDKIEAELQNKVFYRNNPVGEPNTIEGDVDFNNKNVFNVNEVRASDLLIDGVNITASVVASQTAAAASATAAASSASSASSSASAAATSASQAAAAADFIPEIANYVALRAYSGPITEFHLKGHTSVLDGGAGVFRVDAADTTSADNGGTILVDAAGRRWKREFSGAVDVRWFGAKVDGVTDDTSAITAARAQANGKVPVVFGGKTYAAGYWENLSPLAQEWVHGSVSDYKTTVVATKPVTSAKLFTGTPQAGAGFAGYGHRTDVYTVAGVDVASTVGIASFVNALSTNTGGTATNNNTHQVAILANAAAQSATASAPVTAINAIAASDYTGATWQQISGIEVDVSASNPPGFFGDASKCMSLGVAAILLGSSPQSATAAFSCDTSKAGAGWLHGGLLSGCINTGITIARNTVTPHTGMWVSAAGTYGIYVGAKQLFALQPGQIPAFDASHNPAVGIALGQTAATSGRSHYLRFTATDGASAETNFDIYNAGADLTVRYAGADKFAISGATGSILIGGVQVVTSKRTGFTAMSGTTDSATAWDTATITHAQLAQRVGAIQQALTAHGLIGA